MVDLQMSEDISPESLGPRIETADTGRDDAGDPRGSAPFERETPDSDQSGEDGAASQPEPSLPVEYRPLAFIEVTLELPDQHPTVVLQEFDPPHRRVTIPIGIAEGNAIAYAARRIATPRPLTHELMTSVLEQFGIEVLTLRITDITYGNFAGELVLAGPTGQRSIACRVSDGIALCLRQRPPVPITAVPEVVDQAGSPE